MHFAHLSSLLARLRLYRQRQRTRHQLLRLDARLLQDIGLSRTDAEREASKAFWKA